MPAWMRTYSNHKVRNVVIFLFTNSTVQPLKFWNGWVISHTPYWACNYLSMLGLKLIHVTKRGNNHQRDHHSSLICNRVIHDDSSYWHIFWVTVPRWIPLKRPVTRSFEVFVDVRLNKQLRKKSICRWFQIPWRSLWRHCNVIGLCFLAANHSLGFHLYSIV